MSRAFHVSSNRLEGSLCDTPLESLLDSCRQHLVTGTISINTQFADGVIELRAGVVDTATFGELTDAAAIRRLKRLSDGMYELTQQLPDLSGELGDSAQCEGSLADVPLVTIMRHCEDQALSCTITIVHDFDRGEIHYRAGEIDEVTLNGKRDDDAIVDIVGWKSGAFRVAAPPLPLDIAGWPSASVDPTAPFRIEHVAPPRRLQEAAPPRPGLPGVSRAPVPIAASASGPAALPRPPAPALPVVPPLPAAALQERSAAAPSIPPPFAVVTPMARPADTPPAPPRVFARGTSSEPALHLRPREATPLAATPHAARLETDPVEPTSDGTRWVVIFLAVLVLLAVAAWIGAMWYVG